MSRLFFKFFLRKHFFSNCYEELWLIVFLRSFWLGIQTGNRKSVSLFILRHFRYKSQDSFCISDSPSQVLVLYQSANEKNYLDIFQKVTRSDSIDILLKEQGCRIKHFTITPLLWHFLTLVQRGSKILVILILFYMMASLTISM